MALIDLWNNDRAQITDKRIEQLIAFAGEGKLRDGNSTSVELRSLLSVVSSDVLGTWIEECLTQRFSDFGFVVQDIVNEIGKRLNFEVSHGVYRGHSNEGYDGLWRIPNGVAILVESKSSTAYSINLNRIAEYRKQVAPQVGLDAEDISILLVVGTEDTEQLEAQVRGSRFAWDVRLLGISSLFRLLQLKESLDDPGVERQIQEILVPQEFTRLDRIVDLVFATAEDAQETTTEDDTGGDETAVPVRASFHAEILPRLEKRFGKSLVKRSRVLWGTPDDATLVSCQVSKKYEGGEADYWFGLKRTTKEALEQHGNAYCAFGLGSPKTVLLMPFAFVAGQLDVCHTSPEKAGGIRHWHIRFCLDGQDVDLLRNRDPRKLRVSEYLLTE